MCKRSVPRVLGRTASDGPQACPTGCLPAARAAALAARALSGPLLLPHPPRRAGGATRASRARAQRPPAARPRRSARAAAARAKVLQKAAERRELVTVALNTHGTRAVQKLIETLTSREQARFARPRDWGPPSRCGAVRARCVAALCRACVVMCRAAAPQWLGIERGASKAGWGSSGIDRVGRLLSASLPALPPARAWRRRGGAARRWGARRRPGAPAGRAIERPGGARRWRWSRTRCAGAWSRSSAT